MCLQSVMSKDEKDKLLKKAADPMVCWKTVVVNHEGKMYPIHQTWRGVEYHSGVNMIPMVEQYCGESTFGNCKLPLGAHFFRNRKDAIATAKANYYSYVRKVVRCLISKSDIDAVGYSSMFSYSRPPAVTIVAHRATFASVAR